jgi:hypothetical protein
MIDLLITYIPLSRVSDIRKYFEKNYSYLKPKRAIIYVNDSEEPWIRGLIDPVFEVRAHNWGDWTQSWMHILTDLNQDTDFVNAYVIDSDNVLDGGFQKLDDEMEKKGFDFYTVRDTEPNLRIQERSTLVETTPCNIWKYRIHGIWRSIFFIGPKQGVRMSKKFVMSLNRQVVKEIDEAIKKVHPKIRLCITDEATLGVLLYYSGIRFTPWIQYGTHFKGTNRDPLNVSLNALAHSSFARNMLSGRKDSSMLWYYLRNKLALISSSIIRT